MASQDIPNNLNIQIDMKDVGGVWANFASVKHSQYEFTIDFARLDFNSEGASGVIVSRVNLSPLFIRQLIDALEENWVQYSDKAMPKEVEGYDK
jgi:dihydrodipicolinate synthase/N-acetylneuraminate lyase